ncbi:unnamed protein product, partial [Coregonus sp. 'balchen']
MTLRTRSKTIWINLFVWVVSFVMVLPVWVHSKTITSFFLPLPLILTCYMLILCYTWRMYLKNKRERRANNQSRERAIRLTKMVLVLVAVFLVSVGPYHMLQLVNLTVRRPTLAYYTCYYLSVCLSYAASSINPFIYILLSGHFRRRLTYRKPASRPSVEREPSGPHVRTPHSSF